MIKRIRILLPILVILAMLASMLGMTIPVMASQITVTKEHTAPFADFYYVGDTIYYEMTIVNPPANTATNYITDVWDTLPDGTVVYFIQSGVDAPLIQAPGDVEYFYISYVVDEADIMWIPLLDGYGVKNQFQAQGYDSESDDVYGLVTKNSNVIRPEISIEKLVDFDNDGSFTDSETYYAGEPADWWIEVTNTGFDPVYDIYVTDDNGVNYGPFDLLNPGDSQLVPVYTTYPMADFVNTACAEGVDDAGNSVGPVCDPAEVLVVGIPEICIEKTVDFDGDGTFTDLETNYEGEDADWAIMVTNCGDSDIHDIYVSDDNMGVDFYGPFDLAVGAHLDIPIYTTNPMVDTLNTACAEGVDELGNPVGPVCDDAEVLVVPPPCLDIEKTVDFDGDGIFTDSETNYAGEDADWAITVTNCGDSDIHDIYVSDDNMGVDFYGPFDLAAGAHLDIPIYTTNPMVDTLNTACAEGLDELGNPVGPVCDDAEVLVVPPPCLDIEKTVDFDGDGIFGDLETGYAGDLASWAINVTNCGDSDIHDIYVSDDNMGVNFYGPIDLDAGEWVTIIYTTNPTVDTLNTACAEGLDELDNPVGPVCDDAEVTIIVTGAEGCTPGYWKNNADKWEGSAWVPTGYSPSQTLESVFDVPDSLGLDNYTLLQALGFKGGTGVQGAAQILLRAAVAALLNASHPDIDYYASAGDVIAGVNAALASGDRDTMLTLYEELDFHNNDGCVLDMHGEPIMDGMV